MMRYAFGIAVIATWLTHAEAAETHRFENTNDQFAITLTTDWKEVDPKTAPYAKEALAEESDIISRAYQLESETNFAALIFVQIDNHFRVPDYELARLQVDTLRRRFLTERLEVEGLLDSSYDTNRHALRLSSTSDFPGRGKIRLLESVHFTEKGSFMVSCLAPAEHFKSVGPVFTTALDTFFIDPSLAYLPRPNAAKEIAATGETKRVKVHFGFIFGLGAVVLFIARRLAGRVMSDEV